LEDNNMAIIMPQIVLILGKISEEFTDLAENIVQ
jgi:hypothetical protein